MSPSARRPHLAPSALLLLLAVVLTAASCADSVDDADHCGEDLSKCDGACVDTNTDPANCGICGDVCTEGTMCVGGACVTACGGGLTSCAGLCIDTQLSAENCGGCGIACPLGVLCVSGLCNAGCPDGQKLCANLCANIQTDPANCGGCGITCSGGEQCFDGVCGECSPGLTLCGATCVNTNTSEQHCGFCGNACPVGSTCQSGQCTCSGGTCGLCSVQNLGSTVPHTTTGTTSGSPDSYTPSCNSGGSGDRSFSFTAPAAGVYSFDTFGSSYDTVLAVLSQGCGELGCNDDSQGATSQVSVNLLQGQTVLVVVDGYSGSEGSFTLNITSAGSSGCPTGSLGPAVPQTTSGSTVGQGDSLTPSCAAATSSDVSYTFTAPSAAAYVFDTLGSTFDTVLFVLDGSCSGAEIACNDNTGAGLQSSVTVPLAAGQTVVVGIDGPSQGDFVLNVNTAAAAPCPANSLGSSLPQTVTGNTTGLLDSLTPSCGSPGGPEQTYSFTAPAAASYTFDTFGSTFDTILHVHDGACLGAELICNDDAQGVQSQVTVSLSAGQTVIVVVDGYGGASGAFTLNVN